MSLLAIITSNLYRTSAQTVLSVIVKVPDKVAGKACKFVVPFIFYCPFLVIVIVISPVKAVEGGAVI